MAEANTIYNSLVSGLSNTYFSLADSPAANNFLYALANTISNSTTLSYAEYQHTSSSGTDGGTAINGAWWVLNSFIFFIVKYNHL
jgi:hypothetical protein